MSLSKIPKISVLVICYKQENVIGRALDSLISQKDYIYEICINDDASPDKTWDVIKKYQQEYPELIKPVRNNPNLGIFQNIEATWKRPIGDLVYHLSGDDECPDGYFKAVCEYIDSHNIDVYNELVCIYGDYAEKHSSGVKTIYKNNLVQHHDAVRLYCRGLISNRSACYSINILRKFISVSEGRNYKVEKTQEVELSLFTDKNYYIPIVGNVYYSGIGVTVSGSIPYDNASDCYEHMTDFLRLHGYELKKTDYDFFKYREFYFEFLCTKSLKKITLALLYYLKSIDYSLGVDGLQLSKLLFSRKKKQLCKT